MRRRQPATNTVVIESPPLPPVTHVEQTFVPYETSEYEQAVAWATDQMARKYPGQVGMLENFKSMIQQKLRSN